MTINYTGNLGLSLPVQGTESGVWGDVVNAGITTLLDSAVAGTTTLSADADVTLTTTNGAANQARQAILLWTAGGTITRNITAPALSKAYIVINKTSSTQSIVLRGVGPTAGVTIISGEKAVCAWNGLDFVKVGSTVALPAGSTTQVQYNLSGVLTGSANMTFNGTILTATGFGGPLNGSVGATTPSTGAFTTLSASSTVSGVGFSTYLASPPAIGSTTPSSGSFTTLVASGTATLNGTVTGTGINNLFAAPPTIGSVNRVAASFAAVTGNSVLVKPNTTGGGIVTADTNGTLQFAIYQWSTNSSARWNFYKDNVAESGGNVGSDLLLQSIADDGATPIAQAFTIRRSTGVMSLGATPAVGDNTTKVATTAYADRAAFTGATWQSPARAKATTYTNSTGRAIVINIRGPAGALGGQWRFIVAGSIMAYSSDASAALAQIALTGIVVPPGATYSLEDNVGTNTVSSWFELRT